MSTIEDRLRTVEDTLAIFHIIASHPPAADTGNDSYYRDVFAADGTIDLGGGKAKNGNEEISSVVRTPEHQAAIAGGLCHFAGLPRVTIDGDTAVAISYLQVIVPNRDAKSVDVPGHGSSPGYRIHRCGANRWDLKRTKDGWKVTRRAYRLQDGSEDARALLREATAG